MTFLFHRSFGTGLATLKGRDNKENPPLMENVSGINTTTQTSPALQGGKARVVAAIKAASAKTGVDFAYLLNKAEQESGLVPTAKAGSSSATGLYQFIEQTWLKTVKDNGEKYGLGAAADKITIGADGTASVANAADKKAILALRTNPEIAANMAAELALDNKAALEKKVGGTIGSTELYMAHFLGSGGASTFLKAMKTDANASAADILPQAAAANKSVFYDTKTGRERTVSEIYQKFAAKFDQPETGATALAAAAVPSAAQTSPLTSFAQAKAEASAVTDTVTETVTESTSAGSYAFAPTMTSSFATMMLAQMDMETLGLEAMDKTYRLESGEAARRKSALAVAG